MAKKRATKKSTKTQSADAETRRLGRQNMAAIQKVAFAKTESERQIASYASRSSTALRRGVSIKDVAESQRAANLRAKKAASSAAEQNLIRKYSGFGTFPGERTSGKYKAPLLEEEKRIANRYRNQRGK